MPIILAFLSGLATIAGPLAIRVLFSLGMSFVTFKGIDLLMNWVEDQVKGYINGLPGTVLEIFGVMNGDRFIELVFTAYFVRMALRGLQASGFLTKMTWGNPTGGV
jgi:hypothetical protein